MNLQVPRRRRVLGATLLVFGLATTVLAVVLAVRSDEALVVVGDVVLGRTLLLLLGVPAALASVVAGRMLLRATEGSGPGGLGVPGAPARIPPAVLVAAVSAGLLVPLLVVAGLLALGTDEVVRVDDRCVVALHEEGFLFTGDLTIATGPDRPVAVAPVRAVRSLEETSPLAGDDVAVTAAGDGVHVVFDDGFGTVDVVVPCDAGLSG